ncbi:MAG: hypothetical protein ICV66_11285 [Chitinophagaceae bacterium]|nr:hypothetical protein [Chitinophagaceae bacterium]
MPFSSSSSGKTNDQLFGGNNNALDPQQQFGLTTLRLLESNHLQTRIKIGGGGQGHRYFQFISCCPNSNYSILLLSILLFDSF